MPINKRTKVVDALHRTRMKPFLDAAGQNEMRALQLYKWHAQLSSACQPILGITEVFLRNAMDLQLQAWNTATLGTDRSWLLEEPAAPLRSLSQGKRLEAVKRAHAAKGARPSSHPRYGLNITHDDILAQVTFGLWKELLPNHLPGAGDNTQNQNRLFLWENALSHAFPRVNDPDGKETFWRVAHVHGLRNRVSHMDSLLTTDVPDLIDDAFELLKSIDPDLSQWVTGMSEVSKIYKARPKW